MSVTLYVRDLLDDDDPSVNVSNTNFVSIMRLVGYDIDPDDLCGLVQGSDLVQFRADVAFALRSVKAMPELDGGTPAVAVNANEAGFAGLIASQLGVQEVIFAGRRPGYYADVLTRMLAVCDHAIAVDRAVVYC